MMIGGLGTLEWCFEKRSVLPSMKNAIPSVVVCNLVASLLTIEMIWSRPHASAENSEGVYMPEFIRILNKESWVFVISRCALALVLGLLSWPVTIWLVDLYDLYSPILKKIPAVVDFGQFNFYFVLCNFSCSGHVRKPNFGNS